MTTSSGASALLLACLASAVVGLGLGFLLFGGEQDSAHANERALDPGPATARGTTAERPEEALDEAPASRSASPRPPRPAAPRPAVEPARVDAALSRVSAPEAERETGDGVIDGTVTDERGNPLEGAVIVARHRSAAIPIGRDQRDVGGPPPDEPTLEEALRASAESWAEARAARYTAKTDAAGRFRVTGLADGSCQLRAYLEGWIVESPDQWDVRVGSSVDFTARRVLSVTLDLRLPDGTPPENASLVVFEDSSMDWLAWHPESPELRRGAGKLRVDAYAGVLSRTFITSQLPARYRSETVSIDMEEADGSTIVVPLEAQRGVLAEIDDPWNSVQHGQGKLLRLDGADFDEEDLVKSDRETFVHGGRFSFLDLEPGPYAVGVASRGGTLLGHAVVDVGDGLTETTLRIPVPSADTHLVARCYDPDGDVLDGVRFERTSRTERSRHSRDVQARRDPDGAYWLPVADLAPFDHDAWPAGASVRLSAEHGELGRREVDLGQGQREVTIAFDRPAPLTVTVVGYGTSPLRDRLDVTVSEVGDRGEPRDRIASTGERGVWGRGGTQLSDEGVVTFDNVAPGRWIVQLTLGGSRGRGRPIASTLVDLGPGGAAVRIAAPTLHTLLVHAPRYEPGERLRIDNHDQQGETLRITQGADVDVENRARFEDLPSGTYRLRGSRPDERMEVTVPCGEVLFDFAPHDSLRVGISDTSGRLHAAGLHAGDLVVGMDGSAFGDGLPVSRLAEVVAERAVTLEVLRGDEALEIRLGPLDVRGDDAGGTLRPERR